MHLKIKMKIVIIGGTPGSGKTSVIKSVIEGLKDLKIHYVKFDALDTQDDALIKEKFNISSEKRISGDVCPDHFAALEIPKILKKHKEKDLIIIETAGLCLRCSPYIKEGLAINVLNILSGNPANYGPLLTHADIIAITKGDLISQAEREIFRSEVVKVNSTAQIIDANGLTGEGGIDIIEKIKESNEIAGEMTLKHSMPTAICGYCYGNKNIDAKKTLEVYKKGKNLKVKLPNLNCGDCGFKSCNEFIRAVIAGKAKENQCPYIKNISTKTLEGELFNEIEKKGNKNFVHVGFRDKNKAFGDMLESLVPKQGMTRKARIIIELIEEKDV